MTSLRNPPWIISALMIIAMWSIGALSPAAAQANLPPEARMQVLLKQAETSLAEGDEAAALDYLGQLNSISGATRPASSYLLEARLAGRAQDFGRAKTALEGYFKVANSSDADYDDAVQLYVAAERLLAQAEKARAEAEAERARVEAEAARIRAEAARRAEAEAKAVDELAWLTASGAADCPSLRSYLTGSTRRGFADQALGAAETLGCDFAPRKPVEAMNAASASRPVAERAFRDNFVLAAGQGPEMVVLPSGSFTMGSPSKERGRDSDEGPQRTVRIGYQLAVGRYEVTFADWDGCVADGGCGGYEPGYRGWGGGNRPVINVSWNNAQAYVTWLNQKTGLTGRSDRYRLLSEAEWEYAARAGSQARWSFGDDESRLGNFAWFSSNSGSRTQPVGGKTANGFGLYDMHGNVWEWVEDCYEAGYSEQPSDGSAFTKSSCSDRVFRGGSWYVTPRYLRSADRIRNTPGYRGDILGFRLARTLP